MTSAPRWGRSGGMSRSSQRTIVVVPSAPDSRVIRPLPLNEPSWLMREAVRRLELGDRDRVA